MRSRLLILIATVGLIAPIAGIAQTYLTPEQVLQQNNNAFLVPSHQRGARWAADLEAQQNTDRHPAIFHDPSEPVQDNGLPPPVAMQNQDFSQTTVQTNPYGNLDPMTARLLARLEQQNSILASGMNRPLAQTGPAAILSVMAMILATLWTVRKARGLEKLVQKL